MTFCLLIVLKLYLSLLFEWNRYLFRIAKKMEENLMQLEEDIVRMLKTVYDPEIPVNIYDLGLIYGVETDDHKNVTITMTLTAPACPAADFIMEDVRMKVESVRGVKSVDIKLVFEPEWHQGLMSEEAKLELGFL